MNSNIISEDTLLTNDTKPIEEKKTRKYNAAVHAILDIEDIWWWEYLIKKSFWEKKDYPDWIMSELSNDYKIYYYDLINLGLKIAENYNLNYDWKTITVEQFLFPDWTALDNIELTKDIKVMKSIISDIVRSFLIPIFENIDEKLRDTDSKVFFDASLKNFAILKWDSWEYRNYYIDLFVPRIRNTNWKIKEYRWNLHKHPSDIINYRFFSKPGILHNFIRKTYQDLVKIGVDSQLLSEYIKLCGDLLWKYIKKYFWNIWSLDIVNKDFNISINEYESKQQ